MVFRWRGGREKIWANPCTLPGLAGEGATAGKLTGTNQECLGSGHAELGKVRGLLLWRGDQGYHREFLPWGVCWQQGGREQLAGGEGTEVDRVGQSAVGGRLQAPAVCLRRNAEVTIKGVGIHIVGHPRHWGYLRPGGTGAAGCLHCGPLSGPGRRNTREISHPLTRETGDTRTSRPDENGPLNLDSVLCHDRTPRCRSQAPRGVLEIWPLDLLPIGESGGVETDRSEGRGGTGRYPIRGPIPRSTSIVAGDKDGGMADGADLNGKMGRNWVRRNGEITYSCDMA